MSEISKEDLHDLLIERGFDRPDIDVIKQCVDIAGYTRKSPQEDMSDKRIDDIKEVFAWATDKQAIAISKELEKVINEYNLRKSPKERSLVKASEVEKILDNFRRVEWIMINDTSDTDEWIQQRLKNCALAITEFVNGERK